jgi:septum formation protein
MPHPAILLASNSPRRRQLLALTGWTFAVRPADIDETPLPGEAPRVYVSRLAKSKALAAAALAPPGHLVIAADTTVSHGRDLLGKPRSGEEARAMLDRLSGQVHQVCTAICLLDLSSGRLETDLCVSQVPMRSYSPQEIHQYIATGDPFDKAGAYAIQNLAFHPVENFSGCMAGVMGLPLCHLLRTAQKMGFAPRGDLPAACQAQLGYRCPIFSAVLGGELVG